MSAKKMPIWKLHPCASWCVSKHADGDAPADRQCRGRCHIIGRTLADAVEVIGAETSVWELEELRVGLESDFRELIPHVTVSYGFDDPDSGEYKLAFEEAEQLASIIIGLIADARLSGNSTGGKAAVWQRAACPSWCTSAHSDADGPGARSCVSAERHVDLSLEESLHAQDEWFSESVHASIERDAREIEARVLLYLGTGSGVELTLGEAEVYATTLLRLAGGSLDVRAMYVEPKIVPPVAVCAKFVGAS
ncbi:MAG: hypothetical protein JWN52_7218 [Actinomycetia bacterium]|nr:hypothetical protein [Actinomycetes bacterium]